MGKGDLATKSQPPDCGITSVSSREHVCWQFQPTNPQNLIEIDRKSMEKPDFRPAIYIIPIIWRSAAEAAAFKFFQLSIGHLQLCPSARGSYHLHLQ